MFPKHKGWSDEAIRDVDDVLGYGEGAIVKTCTLGYYDYVKLIAAAGDYPKIGDHRFSFSSDIGLGDDHGTRTKTPAWMYEEDGRYVLQGSMKRSSKMTLSERV